MILVDTSVWIDHLRRGEPELVTALQAGEVLMHPYIIGELACGNLGGKRDQILSLLRALPPAPVASDDEALGFIATHGLSGCGIGYLDVHLLAAVALSGDARLWTRDKRLDAVAQSLAVDGRVGKH